MAVVRSFLFNHCYTYVGNRAPVFCVAVLLGEVAGGLVLSCVVLRYTCCFHTTSVPSFDAEPLTTNCESISHSDRTPSVCVVSSRSRECDTACEKHVHTYNRKPAADNTTHHTHTLFRVPVIIYPLVTVECIAGSGQASKYHVEGKHSRYTCHRQPTCIPLIHRAIVAPAPHNCLCDEECLL